MNHSFNIEIAKIYGVAEAIIFENLVFWCTKNKANNTNIKDGLSWTYNSVKAFEELFPYLSKKKIISALKNLEEKGLIITGCFNNNPYDRTKWYAVTKKGYCIFGNREIDLPKWANVITENGKCNCQKGEMNLTDINTDINKDVKPDITYSNECVKENSEEEIQEKEYNENELFESEKPQKVKKFVKPSVEEVSEYVNEKGYSVDAEAFIDFYESKGWLVGKAPMKDWKAAVRTWQRQNYGNNQQRQYKQEPYFNAMEEMINL